MTYSVFIGLGLSSAYIMSHVNDVNVMNDDHVNDVMSHQSSLSHDVNVMNDELV